MSVNFLTLEEAYGQDPWLNTLRDVPAGPFGFDSQVTARITDGRNEYLFTHNHFEDHQHGRPLPRVWQDCPRPFAKIDPRSGQCMDQCRVAADCALGYTCTGDSEIGYCVQDSCQQDTDCETGKCSQGLCQPIACTESYLQPSGLYMYSDWTKTFVPQGPVNLEQTCVATSHARLKGRTKTTDIQGDSRYRGMY